MATEEKISIAAVCRQLGYSKQAYYKTKTNQQLKFYHRNRAKDKVLSIRQQMPRLGTRKLYYLLGKDFKQESIRIGRDKLFNLLREECLLVGKKRRYTKTTDSKHWMQKYPNLVKGLEIARPEQVWVSDITYLATKEGYSYLHLITDAYSKQIMGYCASTGLAASFTIEALKMALSHRQYNKGLIHHSDRGLQYCSAGYVKLLRDNDINISMTQDGSPYDNAIAERINGILKDEFELDAVFDNMGQLKKQVTQAIGLYNTSRPHLSCQMLTPQAMHNQQRLKIKTWRKKNQKNLKSSCDFISSNHL